MDFFMMDPPGSFVVVEARNYRKPAGAAPAVRACCPALPRVPGESTLASGATIHTFEVELSDVDRGVYEALSLRVAQHPSETAEYLVTRLFAYCFEFTEGLAFSRGLSEPDEPALSIHDLTGSLRGWIEIGLPEPARLHRASKASPYVAVYAHRDPSQWLQRVADAKVHRAAELAIQAFDPAWIAKVAARLERRMALGVARSDGEIYLTLGGETLQTVLQRHTVASAQR
jgi:uncharacterized protein YaeQ